MKCPKCSYLGFDTGDRCKNCGHDFSLVFDKGESLAEPDLPLHVEPPSPPSGTIWLDTFSDGEADAASASRSVVHAVRAADPEPMIAPPPVSAPQAAPESSRRQRLPASAPTPRPALPLFSRDDVDAPLLTVPTAPRPPLAVRRTPLPPLRPRTPSPVTVPPRSEEPVLDLGPYSPPTGQVSRDPAPGLDAAPRREASPRLAETRPSGGDRIAPAVENDTSSAQHWRTLWPRAIAGLIDHGILAGIDLVVLYFTLRMTGVAPGDFRILPLAPLLTFLLFVKVAYFGVFTVVGGQTIGKMATRLRVVTEDRRSVGLSRGLWRAAAGLASVIPLGIGLLPILLGSNGRAFHDRVAGTRVVSIRHA